MSNFGFDHVEAPMSANACCQSRGGHDKDVNIGFGPTDSKTGRVRAEKYSVMPCEAARVMKPAFFLKLKTDICFIRKAATE